MSSGIRVSYHAYEAGDVEPDGVTDEVRVLDLGDDPIAGHVLTPAVHKVVYS